MSGLNLHYEKIKGEEEKEKEQEEEKKELEEKEKRNDHKDGYQGKEKEKIAKNEKEKEKEKIAKTEKEKEKEKEKGGTSTSFTSTLFESNLEEPLFANSAMEAHLARKPRENECNSRCDQLFVLPLFIVVFSTIWVAFGDGIMALWGQNLPEIVEVEEGNMEMPESGSNDGSNDGNAYGVNDDSEMLIPEEANAEGQFLLIGFFVITSLTTIISLLWLHLMIRYAPALFNISIFAVCVLSIISAICFFAWHSVAGGIIALMFAAGNVVYYFRLKDRIRLSITNLRLASRALRDHPLILLYGLGILVIQCLWFLIWSMAMVALVTNQDDTSLTVNGDTYSYSDCTTYYTNYPSTLFSPTCTATEGTCYKCVCNTDVTVYSNKACFTYKMNGFSYFCMILAFLWVSTILRNILHCTVSGTVATWWFQGYGTNQAVSDSFKRATTSSLGSISLASLLLAFVTAIHYTVKYLEKNTSHHQTLHAILSCVLRGTESVLEYVNRYALVYVSVYGLDLRSAGKSVWHLFTSKGLTIVANDVLLYNILSLGAIVVAIVGAMIGYGFGINCGLSQTNITLLALIGAAIGYVSASIVSSIIESAVSTIIVCFAEDPEALLETHSELYPLILDAWEKVIGEINIRFRPYLDPIEGTNFSEEDALKMAQSIHEEETKAGGGGSASCNGNYNRTYGNNSGNNDAEGYLYSEGGERRGEGGSINGMSGSSIYLGSSMSLQSSSNNSNSSSSSPSYNNFGFRNLVATPSSSSTSTSNNNNNNRTTVNSSGMTSNGYIPIAHPIEEDYATL